MRLGKLRNNHQEGTQGSKQLQGTAVMASEMQFNHQQTGSATGGKLQIPGTDRHQGPEQVHSRKTGSLKGIPHTGTNLADLG